LPEPPEPPVGLLVLLLRVPGARTLKDKRRVVRGLLDQVAARFRVSVAEVGALDSPGRARVAAAAVSGDAGHALERLEAVARFVEANFPVEIVDRRLLRL
jgi:uncharacterized protein YlxP (DUF503 family)